ncbi:hypothetical protein THAOC_05287, partial [Thalassiosira oceanica]
AVRRAPLLSANEIQPASSPSASGAANLAHARAAPLAAHPEHAAPEPPFRPQSKKKGAHVPEIAAIRAKVAAEIELTKAEITKLRESCFKTHASAFGYANQGVDRPFRRACAATTGARIIQSRIEEYRLPTEFISGDSRASSLDDVIHIDIGHFPPREEKIRQLGNLYLDPATGLPGQVSMRSLGALKILIGHFLYNEPLKEMQEKVMTSIALMDGHLAEADSDLHTNSSKRTEYQGFSHHFLGPSLKAFAEMAQQCRNLKTVTVFGHEMCKELIDSKPLSDPRLRRILDVWKRAIAVNAAIQRGVRNETIVEVHIAKFSTGTRLTPSQQHERFDNMVNTGLVTPDDIESLRDALLELLEIRTCTTADVERAEAIITDLGIDADLKHLEQGISIEEVFEKQIATYSGGTRLASHITDEERAAAIDEDLKQGIGIEEVFKENIATYPCGDRLKSSNQHARLDALVKTGLLPTDTIESLRKEIPKMKSITTIKDRAAAIDADLRQGKSIEDVFKVHIATNPGGGRRSRPQQVDRINAMERKNFFLRAPSSRSEMLSRRSCGTRRRRPHKVVSSLRSVADF